MFYRKHARVQVHTGDELVTKQSHRDECDIHKILRQYQRTGIISHVQKAQASFLELPDAIDYQASINLIMEAEASFNSLPAKVRDHFSNDPANFLAAFSDPNQADTLRAFGFLKPAVAPAESGSGGDAPPT